MSSTKNDALSGTKVNVLSQHITSLKKFYERINESSKISDADFVIVEIGGTIGEYQNAIFS